MRTGYGPTAMFMSRPVSSLARSARRYVMPYDSAKSEPFPMRTSWYGRVTSVSPVPPAASYSLRASTFLPEGDMCTWLSYTGTDSLMSPEPATV